MSTKKRGLGKGLDALFLNNELESINPTNQLKISEIEPNQNQPRKDFDLEALAELADSIRTHGILQPLLVRPLPSGQYQLVAGERRWRASRMAGLAEVPVVIQEISDQKVMEIALIENLQREDLNVLEESLGYQQLMEEYALTQEEVASSVGKSRSSVANALRLLQLPEEVLQALRMGSISKGHAKVLLSLSDMELMKQLCHQVVKSQLSVRQLESLIKKLPLLQEKNPHKMLTNTQVFFREVELSLSENLGTEVKIKDKNNKKTIEIEFFSEEELSNIVSRLSKI